jgi:hypothetical protein
MNRVQMLAVLHGARLALPHLADRSAAERWSTVVAEIDGQLSAGDVPAAKTSAGLAGRRVEIDERFGDRSARPGDRAVRPEDRPARSEPAVLVAQVLKYTFRAIADADWEQAARAEESLRRLSPDLMYEITGEVVGQWLVEPGEGSVGVAATRSGKIVVSREGRLDEYDDLAAAANELPADVVRRAADAVVREFNRQAWIKAQDRHNLPEVVASDGR